MHHAEGFVMSLPTEGEPSAMSTLLFHKFQTNVIQKSNTKSIEHAV